jgi:hypothetical protein
MHVGKLTLGRWGQTFVLDAKAARHLGLHHGPVDLPSVKQLDSQAALALAAQPHGIKLSAIQQFPAGNGGVKLCERVVACAKDFLSLNDLEALNAECASALAAFSGRLQIRVKTWSDEALVALAHQRGELNINPTRLSAVAATALSRRAASTALTFSEFDTLCLSDEVANALQTYGGKLAFAGDVEMSPEAAKLLAERESLILFRSKIKPSIRKVFESAGSWKDSLWTRRARSTKAAAGEGIRPSKLRVSPR